MSRSAPSNSCTGVVPVANGQPYGYVEAPRRQAHSTFTTISRFHCCSTPHSGLRTIHSGLIGGINLYSGAAPRSIRTIHCGVMAGTSRKIPNDRCTGRLSLRAIDVSGLLNVPMPKEGSMTFAGRYGFPNLVLDAIDVDANIDYWDYQYRTEWR